MMSWNAMLCTLIFLKNQCNNYTKIVILENYSASGFYEALSTEILIVYM